MTSGTTFQSGDDLIAELKLLEKTNKYQFEQLYGLLNIIDSKASTLMQFNGIILAVVALILGETYRVAEFVRIFYFLTMILAIVAAGYCYWIVGIYWIFLGHRNKPGKKWADEFADLAVLVDKRTAWYQTAWRMSSVALGLLLLLVLFDLFIPELVKIY